MVLLPVSSRERDGRGREKISDEILDFLVLKKGSLMIPGSPVELIVIDEDTELVVEIEGVGTVTSPFSTRSNAVDRD